MTYKKTKSTPSTRAQYFHVVLMGVAAFIMNTTEFVPVALLSDIALDFSVSTADAGWMLTLYAWVVALMSLPLMLITSRIERKRLLLMIFGIFILSHGLSYYAWNFSTLLVSRVGIAFAHALFWSITAAIAIRLAPQGKKALALSVLATGTSLAMVLGVPLGRMIGQWFDWRTTFAGIGFLAIIVFVLIALVIPPLPSMFKGSVKKVPELLKNPYLVGLYLLCFLAFTAHYTAYSYIEPFLREVGSISDNRITFILLLSGGAGIIGSVLFSYLGERYNTHLIAGSFLCMLFSLMLLIKIVFSLWLLCLIAIVWGIAIMVIIISIQARVIMVDLHAQDMLMSMFSGIINLGIGMGALLGGYTVTNLSIQYVGLIGGILSGIAFLITLVMVKLFYQFRQ